MKNQFKKAVLFLAMVNCASCGDRDISYDGGTRLVLETRIIGTNNNSVPNRTLYLEAYGKGLITKTIGVSKSDKNGFVRFIIPRPDEGQLRLLNPSDESYMEFQIHNIEAKNFANYKLKINPIKIYKKSEIIELNITANRTDSNKRIKKIEVLGEHYESEIDFNPPSAPVDDYRPYEVYFPKKFYVIPNQTIVLRYEVYDQTNSNTEIITETILIENTTVNYTINY